MTLAKYSFNFSAQTQLSSIDLQHLRFAVAAAELGSFRQAAEAMTVRQSTLSRSIMHFEQLIGVSLFERSSGGVTPTLAGRTVLRLARTILEEFETLIATAKSTRSGESGRLAIGFLHIPCSR
jgi:DNA-binding transcriptional LysR family regulator